MTPTAATPRTTRILEPRRLSDLDKSTRARILDRSLADDAAIDATARQILADVRQRGDEAVREATQRFDGIAVKQPVLGPDAFEAALGRIGPDLRRAMLRAAKNLEAVAQATRPPSEHVIEVEPGLTVTERTRPLARVGCYVPGGKAAYPSSVLMAAVPARVAGVRDIIVASPPGPEGSPPDAVLAACAIAGVHKLLVAGGAQAIAALAYGTASLAAVDKIVGPGNRYVTAAKRQVYGIVDIDAPAGPTELIILADDSADPAWVALDLVAQAEHGADSPCLLVTPSARLADTVAEAIGYALEHQPRQEIARAALAARGAILVTDSIEQACVFADEYAPEHLQIMTTDPEAWHARIQNAPAAFLGSYAPVPIGDYLTGANHVLPTGRAGRWASPLSIHSFLVRSITETLTRQAAQGLIDDLSVFARSEGLPGHAIAMEARANEPRSLTQLIKDATEGDA